jgi:hypothetical protein
MDLLEYIEANRMQVQGDRTHDRFVNNIAATLHTFGIAPPHLVYREVRLIDPEFKENFE